MPHQSGQHPNEKKKLFKVKLKIQVTKSEFPIRGPIWGIGSPVSPNFRDGKCWWEEGVLYLDRDREDPPWGCSYIC